MCFDIGTTFTGYAYSSAKEYEEDLLNIHFNEEWMSGHANLHTFKVPSVALVQQDKSLHSYGYEAERKYIQVLDAKQQATWYFFKRFKTDLKTKQLRKDTVILEEGGKSISAISLFSLVLKFLKSHFLDSLDESARYGTTESGTRNYAIKYVLTVPAKWDQASRECMKSAAKKAGISSCYIYSESEATDAYCRMIPIRPNAESQFYLPTPGTKHLIVNLGGTGNDTSLQEITDDGRVKEFSKNVGNTSGGTRVDADFQKFLSSLFGNDFMELYIKKNRNDYLELQYEFEVKKNRFSLEEDVGTKLELPSSLIKMYTSKYKQPIQFLIDDGDFVGKILSQNEYLILDKGLMKDIFGPAVKSTVGYLKNLAGDPETKQCDLIIISGGFAESPVVSGAVKFYFPNLSIVILENGSLATLKGGVLLGHNPSPATSFKPKVSYGIGMAVPFKETEHPGDKLFIAKDKHYCSAVFKPLIDSRKRINIGEFFSTVSLSPNRAGQKSVAIPVYSCRHTGVHFTSDEGCSILGKLKVPVEGRDKVNVRIAVLPRSVIVEGSSDRTGKVVQESFVIQEQ